MSRQPIRSRIEAGPERPGRDAGPGPSEADLREAYSRWASGVTVVAVRDGAAVYAITATAFLPVSLDPPLVLASVGVNATVLPFLEPGTTFGISILAADQRRLAGIFADTGPLARMHFPREGDPVLAHSLATFACTVERRHDEGDHVLVIGRVRRVSAGRDAPPLLFFRREYGVRP